GIIQGFRGMRQEYSNPLYNRPLNIEAFPFARCTSQSPLPTRFVKDHRSRGYREDTCKPRSAHARSNVARATSFRHATNLDPFSLTTRYSRTS
ncbi:hypothetical protein DACRYDRAFT_23802, partial [Dacryopinax primogenitus]